jgi:hypothetical protein
MVYMSGVRIASVWKSEVSSVPKKSVSRKDIEVHGCEAYYNSDLSISGGKQLVLNGN